MGLLKKFEKFANHLDRDERRDQGNSAHIEVSRNGTTSVSSSTLLNIAQRHFEDMSHSKEPNDKPLKK